MCFNNRLSINLEIAAKPYLTCFKIVQRSGRMEDHSYRSAVRGFVYELGQTYTKGPFMTGVFRLCTRLHFDIRRSAFHSYADYQSVVRRARDMPSFYALLECRIPEGTPYLFHPGNNELVSPVLEVVNELNKNCNFPTVLRGIKPADYQPGPGPVVP